MGPPHSQPYMTESKKKTLSITCNNMRIKTQFWCKNGYIYTGIWKSWRELLVSVQFKYQELYMSRNIGEKWITYQQYNISTKCFHTLS